MSALTKWSFIVICLLLALGSYGIGFFKGTFLFVILGLLFELGFWIGIFNVKHEPDES